PSMTVMAPRDGTCLRHALYTSTLREEGPLAIRYPRGSATVYDPNEPMRPLPAGRGEKLLDGDGRVIVLSLGTVAADVLSAAEMVEKSDGIRPAVYDMIYAKPLDADILHEVGRSGLPVVTVEDGTIVGGMGSAVLEWLADNGYSNRVRRLGIPDAFVAHGTIAQLKHQAGFDAEGIAATIKSIVAL
ncbi:MAG: 1-deoxy-D-xylulose-5-phosphate synthase, partial [Muribaculaceae bacterium]|nr:1-deoxy-D-xylulose-5-phosphate synthase [Muribaculaceae bacterium]